MESAEGDVGEQEAADIRAQIARVLRDLGNPEPPLDLAAVTEVLARHGCNVTDAAADLVPLHSDYDSLSEGSG